MSMILCQLWLVTSEMIKELSSPLSEEENIIYLNEDASNEIFSSKKIDILNTYLNNINLVNTFDEDDPDTIILIRILSWYIKYEKHK